MSGSSGVRVDVVIPTRNRPTLTVDALRSVRAQTFTDWHCFVVDDASDDDTAEVVERFAERDPRITVIRRPRPGGGNPARQTGLEASTAPLVALCDSDDVWLPHKLAAQVARWEHEQAAGTPAGVVLCWHDAVGADGKRRGRVLRPSGRRAWHPFTAYNTSTPLIARTVLDDAGGFAPTDPYTARTADHVELYLRLLEHHRSVWVSELLVHCHHHAGVRNSDAQRTRDAVEEAVALLDAWNDRLSTQPTTRAWLHGWVAGRYLELGDRHRGRRFLRDAVRIGGPVTGTRILAYYAPLALRSPGGRADPGR